MLSACECGSFIARRLAAGARSTRAAGGAGRLGFGAMAISPDQQAMLRLLLERGQSYRDLATLLGVEEAEVRVRARTTLTVLAEADPDRNVGLTDYMLGQADPIGRADASRHLRDDPADRALAETIAERLRELFPDAELPRLPGEPRPPRLARRSPQREPSASRAPLRGLSSNHARTLVIGGSAALLLIVIVLAITGAFSGSDEPETTSPATETAAEAPGDEQAVPIQMRPRGGSDAGGVVVFGFASADQPFIEFQIRNLEPPTNEDAYVLWFLAGDDEGFPLPQPLPVTPNGRIDERISVPAEILSFVQQSDSIAIALNDRRELDRSINRAIEGEAGTLSFPGGTVLDAPIRAGRGGG